MPAADEIVAAAASGAALDLPPATPVPLPGGPYDLIIGDLLYTQLIYPGLVDAGVAPDRIGTILHAHGQPLVNRLVADLHHTLAACGTAVHLHDPIGWLPDRHQTARCPQSSPPQASRAPETLVRRGRLVRSGDVHHAVSQDPRFGIAGEAVWRWPFTLEVDYLVWATAVQALPSS